MALQFPQHASAGAHRPPPTAAEREKPLPGQLSVWEPPFTRPPSVLPATGRHVLLRIGEDGPILLESRRGVLVCETSHPPTWYFPRADVNEAYLRPLGGQTQCEFKGAAVYYDVLASPDSREATPVVPQGAWSYLSTSGANKAFENHVAFYLRPPLVATVDGERARPQEGDFYGGWITPDVVGPFKGGPGTRFW
ncbi:hypothetical protein AB1Y20_008069 [Prymnesium parvum]|uniref:DUF427 domain-containing protein n=1 Tax=Prymnesium parvum TaxID=97485 RepID=A0AB34IVK2_PRYPA